MSYDPKAQAMLALAVAMRTGSSSEGLETAAAYEHRQARRNWMLPKIMRPNQEAFESLGFIFEDTGDEVLYQATLPKGWKLDSDGGYWTTIIDEKGRKRGNYFYKGAFYDRSGNMNLSQRFNISCDAADSVNWKGPFTISVKDADDTVLFTAGQCAEAYSGEYNQLQDKCTEYLEANYPEWKNPTKYWD